MITPECTEVVSVPDVVYRALDRANRDYGRAIDMPAGTEAQRAERQARIAAVFEREARWYGVLSRWVYGPGNSGVPAVFGRAAIGAQALATRFAENYRERAEHYASRSAARLPEGRGAA